jgi:hypothetical protein
MYVAHMIGEMHTGFWWGNLRDRDHLENPGIDRSIIQGDQKVSVHLMITIQKVTSNVQSFPYQSLDIYWHAKLCSWRPCSV